MKKLILFILITVLILFFLFGIKKPGVKNDDNTVVFWTLQLGAFDDYINRIINEFEAENPGVKIKRIDVPYSEGEKRTLSAVLTDNPPDLVNLTPDFSLLLAQKNALYFIDEKYLQDYIPAIADTLKYNGKYFGIPFYATSAVTLYNTALFDKFNLNKIPTSYSDIFNYAFKKDKNNLNYLTMISFTENDTLVKLLNKYSINSPQTVKSEKSIRLFSDFKRLFDYDLIPKESVTQTHRDALEKYMSGKLLFLVTGSNFLKMIDENAPEVFKNTEVLPQLTGDSGMYDCSVMNFIIPSKSKNKENALKFALFFTSASNQLEFSKLTSVLPVNKYALNDDYFGINSDNLKNGNEYIKNIVSSDSDIYTKARKIASYQLNYIQAQPVNNKNKKDINTLYSQTVQEILINNKDIPKTLEKFSSDLEKL